MRALRRVVLGTLALGAAVSLTAQTPERGPQTYGTTAVSYIELTRGQMAVFLAKALGLQWP